MREEPANSNYLKPVLTVLLVSLAVRLYLIPLPGHFVDMGHFVRWAKAATEGGIAFVYALTSADYPPGIFYILKPIGFMYQKFISPTFEDTMLLRMLLKLPAVAADLATALMLFFFLRKWKSEKVAFAAMTFYALNPAIMYVSAYWGQFDAVNTFFMFAAIIFLMNKHVEMSWAMFTLSALIKMHALVIAPVLLFVSIKNYPAKRLLKAGILSLLIIMIAFSPFLLNSRMHHVKNVYAKAVGSYPYISVNAFNLWWLFQPPEVQKMQSYYFDGKRDDQAVLGGITCRHLGLLLLGLFASCILLLLRRNSDTFMIAFAAFSMTFAYFMLPTQMHERYLFPMFAFFSVFHHKNKYWFMMYAILTLTFFLNLQILQFNDPRSQLLTEIMSVPHGILYVSVSVAVANTIMFGLFLAFIITKLFGRSDKSYIENEYNSLQFHP